MLSTYGQPDVIWTDEKTQGKVYVGDISAASSLPTLERENIFYVINTQHVTTENYHESDERFTYLRFPVAFAKWFKKGTFNTNTKNGVLRFFNPMFHFIEEATGKGGNVLIHCLAGCHRAGTTGVAWLMYVNRIN